MEASKSAITKREELFAQEKSDIESGSDFVIRKEPKALPLGQSLKSELCCLSCTWFGFSQEFGPEFPDEIRSPARNFRGEDFNPVPVPERVRISTELSMN